MSETVVTESDKMTESSTSIALADAANSIAGVIREKQNFLIIGHLRPDGDCLGSCLGLAEALKQMGKAVRVYTAGPLPRLFGFLPGYDAIETELPDSGQFDAILCVDTADESRVFPGYEPPSHLYVIDHHISNTNFGRVNWVDGQAAAAAEMIYDLVRRLEVEITPEIATALFTGIATDTGSFRFANTSAVTFQIAADLVGKGANAAKIAELVWSSRPPSGVKLAALVLSTLNYEFDGRFVWNEITRQMFETVAGDEAELDGLSGEMRSIEGVEVSVLFTETPEGECRIGFRSKGETNVSTLARLLGGGGHKNASGASIPEPYLAARKRALDVIRDYLKGHWEGTDSRK